MSALEALARALFGVELGRALPVFLLVTARALPLAWLAPWLGWKGTALAARITVGIALALALTPLALASAPALPDEWLALALMGVREVLIGAAFALAASLPLLALGWTGELVDRWRAGSALASSSPLGALHLGAGVVLFVLVGGHRLAIAAFADGLVDSPVGAGADGADLGAFALGAARIVTASLELAAAFAAPAALAFVLLELALALAARVGPELALWASAVPLRAALGIAMSLLGLAALLPRLPALFAGSIDAAAELVRRLSG